MNLNAYIQIERDKNDQITWNLTGGNAHMGNSIDFAKSIGLLGDPDVLIKKKGIPPTGADFLKPLECDILATWLYLEDIYKCIKYKNIKTEDFDAQIKIMLKLMEEGERMYGRNSVRMIAYIKLDYFG